MESFRPANWTGINANHRYINIYANFVNSRLLRQPCGATRGLKDSEMRIVVTGGAGFIGTNLLTRLVTRFPHIECVSFDNRHAVYPVAGVKYVLGNVQNLTQLDTITKSASQVYHLAGALGTNESFRSIRKHVSCNIVGAVNILTCARTNRFELLIVSKPNVWLNPYTVTKKCADEFVEMYVKEYGVKVVTLKLFNVYGPFEIATSYRKAVPTFVKQALGGKPLEIYGDGMQEGDFVFVGDVVDALIDALELKLYGNVIEYGTGVGTKIINIARIIIEMCGSNSTITFKKMRIGESEKSKVVANISKLAKKGLRVPATELCEGLSLAIDFHRTAMRSMIGLGLP